MYKVYDKQSAIREVQKYLSLVGDATIYVAPTGIYDDNTKNSVLAFQERESIEVTGVVDKETFDRLYLLYAKEREKNEIQRTTDSFILFPLLPDMTRTEILPVNRMLARLLTYYGFTHNIRESNYFSNETLLAVRTLREIYMLTNSDIIDEEFYLRMIKDHDSIGEFNNNFVRDM